MDFTSNWMSGIDQGKDLNETMANLNTYVNKYQPVLGDMWDTIAASGIKIKGTNNVLSKNGDGWSLMQSNTHGEGAPYTQIQWDPTSKSYTTSNQKVQSDHGFVTSLGNSLEVVVPAAIAAMTAGAAGFGPLAGTAEAAGAAGTAEAAGAAATEALPAGGMAATGTAAPWAATAPELGSGMFGTGTADIGALMGTTGGAFDLGTGLAGVTAADLASAGAGTASWLPTAQGLGKLLSTAKPLIPSSAPAIATGATGGQQSTSGGFGGANNYFNQQQSQAVNVMPTFGATPSNQNGYATELNNSQNIKQLAAALMGNKGNFYG